MIAQERFRLIADLVMARQKMSVHELHSELQASPATLRRDLAELETLGKLVRVRGGIVHPSYFRGEPSFAQKQRSAAGVKRSIARVAAGLVPPKATVWIDAGTTCLELGALLLARLDLTILTHSIPLAARAVASDEGARVVMIGGEVRSISGAAVGALSLSWSAHLRADFGFFGASGLSAIEGASTTELSEASIKSAFLKRCAQRVLLCDAGKWEKPATVNFGAWNAFDIWVSDADKSMRKRAEKAGVQVLTAVEK